MVPSWYPVILEIWSRSIHPRAQSRVPRLRNAIVRKALAVLLSLLTALSSAGPVFAQPSARGAFKPVFDLAGALIAFQAALEPLARPLDELSRHRFTEADHLAAAAALADAEAKVRAIASAEPLLDARALIAALVEARAREQALWSVAKGKSELPDGAAQALLSELGLVSKELAAFTAQAGASPAASGANKLALERLRRQLQAQTEKIDGAAKQSPAAASAVLSQVFGEGNGVVQAAPTARGSAPSQPASGITLPVGKPAPIVVPDDVNAPGPAAPSQTQLDAQKVVAAAAAAALPGPLAQPAQSQFDEAQREELQLQWAQSAKDWLEKNRSKVANADAALAALEAGLAPGLSAEERRARLADAQLKLSGALYAEYVAFNRKHLATLPDGTRFAPQELALPAGKDVWVKKTVGGVAGLERQGTLKHWESLDGATTRDERPDGTTAETKTTENGVVVTVYSSKNGTRLDATTFTPVDGDPGLFVASSERRPWPKSIGRFGANGFAVEETRNQDGSTVAYSGALRALAGPGGIAGWSVEASDVSDPAALARAISQRRGASSEQERELAALLADYLTHAKGAPARLFFRADGGVVIDEKGGAGVFQAVARWEGDRLVVFVREAKTADDPDILRFTRVFAYRDGGSSEKYPANAATNVAHWYWWTQAEGALDAQDPRVFDDASLLAAAAQAGAAVPRGAPAGLGLSVGGPALAGLAKLASGGLTWDDALLQAARATLGFDLPQEAASFLKQARTLTTDEQAEYRRTLDQLSSRPDEAYLKDKLAQRYDLQNPKPEDLEELRQLKELQDYYDGLLPGGQVQPGYAQSIDVRAAQLKALKERLEAAADDRPVRRGDGSAPPVDPTTLEKIKKLLDEIEGLRSEAKGEMANRDAAKQLLAVQNGLRNEALKQRRDGKNELKLHQNLSRLDTVMRASFALKVILQSEAYIKQQLAIKQQEIAAAQASIQQAQQNLAAAQANAAQVAQWKAQAQKDVQDDQSTQGSIQNYEKRAANSAARFKQFQTDVSAQIAAVNARDKGTKGSPDAMTEYVRRINLLPTIVQWRTAGNPNDPNAFSLKQFNDIKTTLNQKLADAQAGQAQLNNPNNAVNFAGVVINAVPGPSGSFTNRSDLRNIITARKADYQSQRATYQSDLDSIQRMMGQTDSKGSSPGTSVDEFGDAHTESLPRWRDQSSTEESQAQGRVSTCLAQIDAAAAQINSVAGSNLPMLSGKGLTDLQNALKTYGDKLRAVKIGDDTDAQHEASLNEALIADLLPRAADDVITWSKDDGIVKAIDDALNNTLPQAKTGIQGIVAMMDAIISDCDKDLGWINSTSGESNQGVFDRKEALLNNVIVPALRSASTLVDQLIAYQKTSIAQAQPNTGDLWTLYDAKKSLMQQTLDLYNKTVPWAIATFGGSEGDAGGSHATIKAFRDNLAKYMNPNGYDDASGHHESVPQFQQDMTHRKDPSYAGTEVLYGETQPYSLPKKISQYAAERASRAPQINANDQQINDILTQIEQVSKGKYSFGGLRMPVGVTGDAAGLAKVQAVVDAHTINQLSDKLKAFGNDANANSGALQVGSGNSDSFPTGTQPPIVANDMQRIALMCVDAGKRLVPTSFNAANPDQGNATYAIARFLYSDSVVSAANDALQNQVPVAVAFLDEAASVLNAAVANTNLGDVYVDAGGKNETADAVFARQIALFQGLDRMLTDGSAFFQKKIGWDQAPANAGGTIDKISSYYSSLVDIYNGAVSANQNLIRADQKIIDALNSTMNGLEQNRVKLAGWLAQLDDPHDSALRRVNESISDLQDQTRAVLERNLKWHDLNDQLTRSNEILKSEFTRISEKQDELSRLLSDPSLQDALPPDLVARIDKLKMGRGMWDMDAAGGESIVIRKSQFAAFVDALFGMFANQASTQNLGLLKADILSNPQNLSSLLPDAQLIDFGGGDADGFYLVYQSNFSVPNGLNTGSWVTLGNVGKIWGNNISVAGYQFASPPEPTNAPYGDKGVELKVESLQGRNWVNYLDVDLHRFAFDIPPDMQTASQAKTSRLMVFDDFAVMLFGDKLYIGAAGFGDAALSSPGDNPSYYGGNVKTSLKLTEVMRLNAEQQVLFAKDPQQFLQQVNVSGYDQYLNGTIYAKADDKNYYRTQIGPSIDVGRLISNVEGKPAPADTFTVDMFWSKTGGTDDINQQAVGASILKGFTIKDDSGKPWMVIQNKVTGELGQQYNTLTDRLSITLPNYGVVVTGQGQLLGDAKAYYASIGKKLGDNSTLELAYGSPYVGLNNRLSLTMNSSFTLGQLWSSVAGGARQTLEGGQALQQFNRNLEDFFKADANDARVQELKRVWEQDVARKLIMQDIGALGRRVAELRKAGAILDNTRVRGMVGWVSNPISNDTADRAVGGGFVVGTQTELSMKKTQKAEIDADLADLFVLGVKLQEDLVDVVEKWQACVVDLAQAQWELKAETYMVKNGPSAASRQEALVKAGQAESKLHQALIAYNALTGRGPADATPFDNLTPADLEALTAEMRKTIAVPDRFTQILKSLDPADLKKQMGDNPFNLADYIPIVDQFTLGIGVQLQDLMANQIFGVGGSIRIPLYDPSSKAQNKAYLLESKAAGQQILEAFAEQSLRTKKRREQAEIWRQSAAAIAPGLKEAAARLGLAVRAYRNGLSSASELDQAFDAWHWYIMAALDADAHAALAEAWAALDSKIEKPSRPADHMTYAVKSVDDAIDRVFSENHGLAEIALRGEAADEMTQANDHRIQKAFVDVHVGYNLTASGTGWLPSIGYTGIPVTPIPGFEFKPEELRELEVHRDQSQAEYYRQLQAKVKAGLAVQFAQNVIDRDLAAWTVKIYDEQIIPKLEKEGPREKLDEAKRDRAQAQMTLRQSEATLNFLLGRPADSSLRIEVTPEQAIASLQAQLAVLRPVDTQKALLDSRVKVARDVETIADKDLKLEQLAMDPISLTVRSLSRLLTAIGGDHIGNPELVAAARVQTLGEERARESYDVQLKAGREQARAELSRVEAALSRLGDSQAPEAQLARLALYQQEYRLKAALLALQDDPNAPTSYGPAPSSFAELKNRLEQKQRAASAQAPETPVEVLDPAIMEHQASSFLRYYYAHETLGKTPIDKSFTEGWIEVRLKSQDTPPEVLLALAKLREEKADRIYRTQLSGADAKADILAADFQADVQMLRWARRAAAAPRGAETQLQGNMDEFARQLALRLASERDAIVAQLGLAPGTTLDQLAALVPEDASGDKNLLAMAERFLGQVRAMQLERIKTTLFDGAPPPAFGTEDNLINQLKADTIAERMSYKGFTPVAAFGAFRSQTVSSGFLEAPDPRSIETALENVLTDALRKELVSTGRIQELTLKLHSLMSRVEDGSRLIEKQRDLIAAAEDEYKALMGRARTPQDLAEAELARGRIVEAWLGLSRQLTDTKADFISLVTELEALGAGEGSGLRPYVPPIPELSPAQKDARQELLAYWAERFQDYSFDLDPLLDSLEPPVPADYRARLTDDVAKYRLALWNADVIRHKDFTDAEKLELLSKTDAEGRRLALVADLDALLKSAPDAARTKIVSFLRQDLEAQSVKAGADRARYAALSSTIRGAYWAAAAPGYRSIYESLEAKAKVLDAARQSLLERALTESTGDPSRFILKDVDLDAYLRAQEDFDRELTATLARPEVRQNRDLAMTLDALYGIRGTLERRMARARSGRGMAALDALIMLQDAKLSAARWDQRPPDELDAISRQLEELTERRARWSAGAVDLSPLYALTTVDKDGRRQWSVEGWLTRQEVDAGVKNGTIVQRDGRLFMGDKEVVGGIDAAESRRQDAQGALDANARRLQLAGRLDRFDLALDRPARDGSEGLSLDQVFGPNGKNAQGRVFYFEAPQPGEPEGRLHNQIHPLQALALPPEKYVMMIYDGNQSLSRDRFPTLESLNGSDEEKNFLAATLSAKGALALIAESNKKRQAELAKGWLDVKLNGYAFARDRDGAVSEIYTTEDDFNAVVKAFKNAEKDLAQARKDLAAAQAEEARLKAELGDKKSAAESANTEYQRAQLAARERIFNDMKTSFPRQGRGESDQVYQARFKVEWDKRVSNDSQFKDAQKRYEPFAKAFTKASDAYKLAQAKTVNAKKAVDEGVALLERSKTWSLYLSDNMQLTLDKDGTVLSVADAPAYGNLQLNEVVQAGTTALVVTGPIYAAAVDGEGRLKSRWQDKDAVEKAAGSWQIKSVVMSGENDEVSPDGRTTKPIYRLSHYEDPSSGLPVALSRRYLVERVKDSQSKAWKDKNWGLMPWNWGNLVLELPRGVVGAPIELITGRDPNQQHYLGRVYMYKTEGGETEHHGFFRKVAGVVDVLNLLPDPVSRFYDPSQFPSQVALDSRVLPGQSVLDKDARDGKHDVHYGTGMADRAAQQSLEDLTTARARTLAHFHGGAEETIIEQIRGRAGEYEESKRIAQSGADALKRALLDPIVGSDPLSDGSGTVVAGARPGNIAVDRVERHVRIMPGADQYGQQQRALDGYDVRLASGARVAAGETARLQGDLRARQAELDAAKNDRRRAREQAIDQAIARSARKADDGLLARWREYVKRLYSSIVNV